MQIEVGFDITYEHPAPTPMMLAASIHPSREVDLVVPETLRLDPHVHAQSYIDSFGNRCTRLVAPAGPIRFSSHAVLHDNGAPDPAVPFLPQTRVDRLPEETLVFLLGSRYCETDLLSDEAWRRFGSLPSGSPRVQAICDFVHHHIQFGYDRADPTKTAAQALATACGVCRDFTHLAVTLTRCMSIPARYCAGYVTDIGLAPPYAPMDFAAWFEAYLDGQWWIFDPRNHAPRVGRILMARGRDATDVAISNTFGLSQLRSFSVVARDVRDGGPVHGGRSIGTRT